MHFIEAREKTVCITCVCVSENKKFLAVGEKVKDDFRPYVSVYDLQTTQMRVIRQDLNIFFDETFNSDKYITII